ncbi:MAG: hypothetical protein ABR540_15765 [Acidimicrobiales bacterium]
MAPLLAAVLAALLLLSGCGGSAEERQNVQPPEPGTPDGAADVQGIYRSISKGVLQLRGDGEFVLIVSEAPGASAGTYTLESGRLTVRTDACGTSPGTYELRVGGRPVAGKAILSFTALQDDCDSRRRSLTSEQWVYADS